MKKVIKNGIFMYLLQFFNTITPLLTIPYITRILGPVGYGSFSMALNIIGYMQVIVEYGFGMSATRKIAQSHDSSDVQGLFTRVIFSRIILMLFCFLLIAIFFPFYTRFNVWCLLCLLLCLVGVCFQQTWLFQGLQEMSHIAIINIVSRTLSVILVFALVKTEKDLLLYCILYSVSPLLSGILGFMIARKRYNLSFQKVDIKDIMSELKSGWYVFTTQFSSKIFSSIGITFLGVFTSEYYVGIYSAIQKISIGLLVVWMPISQILYPISSRWLGESFLLGKKKIQKVQVICLFIFGFIVLGLSIAAKMIVVLAFGQSYVDYYWLVMPLLLWVWLGINNNFCGTQILLGSGYDKEYSKCFQMAIIFTVLINLVLICFDGIRGAAFSPLFSELILAVLLNYKIRKISKINMIV
jgi:PST family polysaccharide transporter